MKTKLFILLIWISGFAISGVKLSAQSVIFQDFENLTSAQTADADKTGSFICYNPGWAFVTLVDNPNKSGINTSNKVAAVSLTGAIGETGTSPNSGLILISLTNSTKEPQNGAIPACSECTNGKYDRIRFKFYKGNLYNRYIRYQPDGTIQTPLYESAAVNAWEYITFDLLKTNYVDIRFALNRKADDSGMNIEGVTEGTVVYIDDIEFFSSTNVSNLSIPNAVKNTSCLPLGNNVFNYETTLDKVSNVKVELISLDGRSETIFNQNASGKLEFQFSVKNKGIYCVRTIVDNQSSETLKAIAR